jgi:hypothetical protein
MSKKLFVSYSRKDKAMAQRVADALEVQGYEVFWDAAIPPGQKFDAYILEQLRTSDAVLVLWSSHSVESDYVKEEADYAKTNKVLVPLRIDETALPFGFTRIQTTDLLHWHGSIQDPEWRRVVDAIESSIANQASAQRDSFEEIEIEPEKLEASRRSIPVQVAKAPRTHVSASAILAIAIVMIMLLGIFVFALRLV